VTYANVADVADAELAGQVVDAWFRKVPAVVTVAGAWYDYSMAPGNPAPQYYAASPLAFTPLARSTDGGIQHGGNVSPSQKVIRRMMALCVTAGGAVQRLTLCDYLGFYPFVDMGTAEEQPLDNTDALTRSTDGGGVQIMAVLVAPHGLAGDTFFVTYTNQDGTAGRVTPLHTMTTAVAVNGTLLTTQTAGEGRNGPFLTLQAGDSGVRSIQSVQCTNGIDVGLFTLVLVKPLADLSIRGVDAPSEVDFLTESGRLPVVSDDAYLNFIACPNGSLSAAALIGDIAFTWRT
jgi:hypothetical protein